MKKWGRFILCIIVMTSCKKPYLPPVISSPGSYLVVEGVISGTTPTTVKLSYTVNLSNTTATNPASKAVVTVENDQNGTYQLAETTPGTYVLAGLALDNSRKYRLSIKTADNKQYLSDFVPVVNSPAIDSVGFQITGNGLNIYSNTHDPQNNTHYYRWDYQETWVIQSTYFSAYKSNGDTVLARNLATDNVYQCWASDTSSTIIINSSAKLASDVISGNPITSIPSNSEKIGIKYSILVNQYALTGDAYAFWTNLKKNTEQLGSIFDAQPSQINGNIHCVSNPAEAVIGYVSVGNVATKRIFITSAQLPNWLPTPAYPNCVLDTFLYVYYPPGGQAPVNQINLYINYNRGAVNPYIPVEAIQPPLAAKPIGYSAALPICVDCTLRGTNKQPSFWR